MIPYLFHVSILLGGCYIFYWFFLRQETFFRLNRIVLLACLFLPMTIPLITIPANWSLQLLPANPVSSIVLPVLADSGSQEKEDALVQKETKRNNSKKAVTTIAIKDVNKSIKPTPALSVQKVLTYLYFSGVIVFVLAFFIQLVLIMAKRNTLNSIKDGKYKIVELVKEEAPFSFWRSIFINPASYDPDTYEQILAHEKIHIDQAHFFDKLLAEFLLVVLWFNPFIWLFRKVISNNLEFLTDQSMLTKGFPKQAYQLSLFKVSVPQYPLNLTTNYNQSFLKNRIAMMNTKKSSARSIWKYLFLLPLLGFSMMSLNTIHPNEEPAIVEVDHPASSPIEETNQEETPKARIATSSQAKSIVPKRDKRQDKKTVKQLDLALNYGLWTGTLNGNEVCFLIDNIGVDKRQKRRLCFSKKEITGLKESKNQEFSIKQEQGTLFMEGSFSTGKGQGVFKFQPNPSFVKFLKNEEKLEIKEENIVLLFVHRIDKQYIKNVIQESTNKNIKRHSISFNDDHHVFAIVNKDNRQTVKADNHVDTYTTNNRKRTINKNINRSNHHSDGQVHIETINGTTYIQGAGVHEINGKTITVSGDETWVVTQDGNSYRLEEGMKKKEKSTKKRKTDYNAYTVLPPIERSGTEKRYLILSGNEGNLAWVGYTTTILEPSTQALWKLPEFCQAFQTELVQDGIIDDGDKFIFYFGKNGAYVNGWHLSNGQDTKYVDLARKYDIPISKDWHIEVDGQNVLVVGAVADVKELRDQLQQAFVNDQLVSNKKKEALMKISGNQLSVNGKVIPQEKLAKYFRILRKHRVTPAPGKIIQFGRKKNKHFIHVGYGGDNSFLGTFSTD